uniref:DNA-dependent protein kinase catalytic subunit n=1 Tax=Cacopsylla melanoneura TaxID=428564 RepID=A0A8D8ZFM5_9HEMI
MVLKGLLDKDQSLQDKNFARLSEHYRNTTPVSLLTQLFQDLYLPSMESHLLSFVSYFLMDNTKHSADYSTLLFSHPLEACSYRQQRLLLSHRARNLTYAPLFINSLASQLLGLSSTQTVVQGDSSGHRWQLRATNEGTLQFEPTVNDSDDDESVISSEVGDVIPVLDNSPPGSQSLTRNSFFKLSRRFVRNSDHLKQEAIRHHSNRNWQRRLLLNDKHKLKSSQISLTRGYRTGDFPDIQISYSSVLNPLQSLVARDRTLAQLLVHAVFMYLSRTEGSSEFMNSSVAWFKHILTQGVNDPTLTALILEICSHQNCLLNDDVISINEVAKTSGLLYHGILLTETKLLANIPNSDKLIPSSYGQFVRNEEDDEGGEGSSRKKFKIADHHVIHACHTELIDMYKSLDESDIINGILSQQQNSNLKAALDAEQSALYRRANKYYAACLQDQGATVAPSVLYDSYCQTFQWLSKWGELEKLLEQEVQGDWNNAINKESYVMKHLLRCQILKSESPSESFLTAFKSWTDSSPEHYDILKLHLAQSTSILLLLLNQYPQCCHLAELNISQQLSTYKSRVSQVNNLCVAMETSLLSKTLQFPNEYNVARLSNVWDMTCDDQDDLATLEIKVKQRKVFLDKVSTGADGNLTLLRPNLFARNVANSLSMIRSAIGRNQFYYAREHLNRLVSTVSEAHIVYEQGDTVIMCRDKGV